jgi:hypothetical protein
VDRALQDLAKKTHGNTFYQGLGFFIEWVELGNVVGLAAELPRPHFSIVGAHVCMEGGREAEWLLRYGVRLAFCLLLTVAPNQFVLCLD